MTLAGQAKGFDIRMGLPYVHMAASHDLAVFDINWGQMGPVKERAGITSGPCSPGVFFGQHGKAPPSYGPTELVAVARCYVQSVLGDEVDLPDELVVPNEAQPVEFP